MEPISVTARSGAPADTDADTRVVGLFEGGALEEPELQALVDAREAKGGLRKLAVTHEDSDEGRRRVIVAGLGKSGEFDPERARGAAAAAAKRAGELGARSLSWAVPAAGGGSEGSEAGDVDVAGVAGALVEGTLLALYRFDRFKSSRGGDDGAEESGTGDGSRVESLEVTAEPDVAEAVEHARVAAEAQNAARDLQNLPANVATPQHLAERAEALASAHEALSVETFDRDGIAGLRMGAFGAVAQGTDTEPRLIVIRYEGRDQGPHLALVGKAVTFDTGGISIKPAGKMHEMKFDMSGGAAVIEAMGAIAELGLSGRITAIVPSTDNMPSGRSVRPGDIVTAMNGKTIEVNNTDAEGRLLLADALAYAVDQGAERIVDLATLTGAIVVALGSTYAGLFSNDDQWCREVQEACEATGELAWRLPLHPEYLELTKGRYADLTNASEQRKAMSSYAAEFLRQFVDGTPWAHLDIAGTAWGLGRPYVGDGASGFGVRALLELVRRGGAP